MMMIVTKPVVKVRNTGHSMRAALVCALLACDISSALTLPPRQQRSQCVRLHKEEEAHTPRRQHPVAIGATLAAAMAISAASPSVAFADGSGVFEAKCMGCHAGGGNVVVRNQKTLRREDLSLNDVYDETRIASLVEVGRGAMPGFGELCTPKGKCTFGPRLSDAEIREVSVYVMDEAKAGWPAPVAR